MRPLVTVLIPARNEAPDICGCIDAVGHQTYPLDRLEVIVVDGESGDGTAHLAESALSRHPFAASSVKTNPEGTTPSSLNLGLESARGSILCRVDARSRIDPDYIATCVGVLVQRPEVKVVGGSQRAMTRVDSVSAAGIARALNNRYSTGLAAYRRARQSGPADTVYLGAFRTCELREAGGWDLRFSTNQDFELNRRLGSIGIVWFEASLETGYLPRRRFRDLWRQYRRFGQWKVRYWRHTNDRPRPRQLLLLAGVPLGAALAAAAAVRRPLLTGLATMTALLGVDAVGSDQPARITTRLAAVSATVVSGGAWVLGIWSEIVRPTTPEHLTR